MLLLQKKMLDYFIKRAKVYIYSTKWPVMFKLWHEAFPTAMNHYFEF